ncbi:MAG: long-chain fatty acid--CoA ligase, partial [Spirochaetaceae bacterium]|nr:long-chain fatty acid--CoA ligase [Spirochaetaceae bacterium]
MEKTIPRVVRETAEKYPHIAAQYARAGGGEFEVVTYNQMIDISLDFSAGLLANGVKREDHIGLISDNRKEWFQIDLGIMGIGAIDVPRGCDASERDLAFILSSAECKTVVAENASQVRKILDLRESLPLLKTLIMIENAGDDEIALAKQYGVTMLAFEKVLEAGKLFRQKSPGAAEAEWDKGTEDDLACIIFTSGTTGEPKGVMLSHKNFIAQLDELQERIYLNPGEKALLVLPVWHVFERLCEYVITSQATALCYSKPIGSVLLPDLQKLNPQLFPAVPRVFEAIYDAVNRTMRKTGGVVYILYKFFVAVAKLHARIDRRLFRKTARFGNDFIVLMWILLVIPWLLLYPLKLLGGVLVFKKIRAKLGTGFRAGVSGGGALPRQIDEFYWAIGVNIVEGYGLTETAPVISVRPIDAPVFGTVGTAVRHVQARIVSDDGKVLPVGVKGEVQINGDTVMKGYYKRDDLTQKAIDRDGWLSTGDIGMLTVNKEIVLRGRKKDTIVLRGGENAEPLPIEMKLNESQYISQSVVIGQDQRSLGALIVPEKEEVIGFAEAKGIAFSSYEALLKHREVLKLFEQEIHAAVNTKSGFRLFERIGPFCLLPNQFETGRELSAKQEIAR